MDGFGWICLGAALFAWIGAFYLQRKLKEQEDRRQLLRRLMDL